MTDDTGKQTESDEISSSSLFTRRTVLAGVGTLGVGAVGAASFAPTGAANSDDEEMTDDEEMESDKDNSNSAMLTVRIENVSTTTTLETSSKKEQPVPLSPGAFAVHHGKTPLFVPGKPVLDNGLEEIAEDGKPMVLAEWLSEQSDSSQSGAFTTPVGKDNPSPLGPGAAYEFEIEATPGDRLSFATMFVPSNDLFYSPDEMGIKLFEEGEPIDGDVTDHVQLWDAGTEVNEEPGVGANQAQRQSEPGAGEKEDEPVALVSERDDCYTYPDVTDVIEVTISK